mgnify:CR=1 FL=1
MKQIRNGGDYVAVDILEKDGTIKQTPIYLTINKPKELLWFDQEEKFWSPTTVMFNGKNLDCVGDDGFEWESEVEELLTEARPKGHATLPGDSD